MHVFNVFIQEKIKWFLSQPASTHVGKMVFTEGNGNSEPIWTAKLVWHLTKLIIVGDCQCVYPRADPSLKHHYDKITLETSSNKQQMGRTAVLVFIPCGVSVEREREKLLKSFSLFSVWFKKDLSPENSNKSQI